MAHDRRRFLKAVGAGALTAAFPPSIQRALATPARHGSGSIRDIEHIVILMQENRSFDHYYGTMRGVRGYGDPRAARLPSGDPVFAQPTGSGVLLPFRDAGGDLGNAFLEGTPHNWPDAHQAWNGGKYDQWVPAKGTTTMSYLRRDDIPYHFALADAFTVCDAYHCSFMGATDPNRYHMWTGWVGNDGKAGGPVVDNSELGYDWHTFPEHLDSFGISWKIYQDAGAGLDAEHFWGWGGDPYIGNYGDNSLLYFHQYQNAAPDSPLRKAFNATDISQGGTLFDQFWADVAADSLPQVSWIVAPEAYTEHSNWPSNYGAWYVDGMLEALLSNPKVFAKTAFFLTFDENDGLFDHVIPPTPPETRAQGLSTVPITNEIYPGNGNYAKGPYGFGSRVPMLVVSPWSKGGWVCSELFDHTSLIQFIEQRFERETRGKLFETNITPWRRAIAGDLTSCFDFKTPSSGVISLPSTTDYEPPDYDRHPDYVPVPPATQVLPKQEPGVRPARAVPYELDATGDLRLGPGTLELRFDNSGKAAAVFQVRAGMSQSGPWTYTVGPNKRLSETFDIKAGGLTSYDYAVHGPNGFFRSFRGSTKPFSTNLAVRSDCDQDGGVTLDIKNLGSRGANIRVYDAYTKRSVVQRVDEGCSLVWHFDLDDSYGWYDLTVTVSGDALFLRRIAGHVETGHDSVSDPAFGV
jgi:phospholipase C